MQRIPQFIVAALLAFDIAVAGESAELEPLDTDRDGRLSENEWRHAKPDVAFHEIDVDEDGYLSSREIRQVNDVIARQDDTQTDVTADGEAQGKGPGVQRIRFETHDADEDGYLSPDEWQEAGVNAAFDAIDENGDRLLTEREIQQSDSVELQDFGSRSVYTNGHNATGTGQ